MVVPFGVPYAFNEGILFLRASEWFLPIGIVVVMHGANRMAYTHGLVRRI
jgi:hypothetical protein